MSRGSRNNGPHHGKKTDGAAAIKRSSSGLCSNRLLFVSLVLNVVLPLQYFLLMTWSSSINSDTSDRDNSSMARVPLPPPQQQSLRQRRTLDASSPLASSSALTQSDDSTSSGNIVGAQGGAWTAQTHLSQYGFNVDWGLLEVLEDACREIENRHNSPASQWYQYQQPVDHPLNGWWVAPKVVDCKVMEIGCGVGVYVDALKKEASKRNRQVFGMEPNPMGGTFERLGGPQQLAVNILEQGDPLEFATRIRHEQLQGKYFDLIYSIEVLEHMPLERHEDVARFLAGLATVGTKLILGAATPGQRGTGHIGNRPIRQWEQILKRVGFEKDVEATVKAQRQMQEYNHKKNTQVYIYHGNAAATAAAAQ